MTNQKIAIWITTLILGSFTLTTASSLTLEINGESAENGASAQDSSCELFGQNSFTGTAGNTIFTDEQSYSHNMGLRMTVAEDSQGFGSFGGIINFRDCTGDSEYQLIKGDEFWVRTRIYIPSDWEYNQGRSKFLRFRTYYDDENDHAVSHGYIDLYLDGHTEADNYQPFWFIYEGAQQWYKMGAPEDALGRDQWRTIEMYIKLDDQKASEGGDSVVRIWLDGEFIGESFERNTLARPDSYAYTFNFFTWFGNEGSPKDQSLYVDDIYFTTETPADTDSEGNPYIGMGEAAQLAPPKAPSNLRLVND